MATINTTDDLLRLLDENEQFRDAARYKILTEDLLKLPNEFKEFREKTDKSLDSLRELTESNARAIESNTKAIEANRKAIEGLLAVTTVNTRHVGEMRGLFAAQKVKSEAALIVDRLGLSNGRVLELQEIIDIWNAGKANRLTDGIAKRDEDSFKTADLIIEAQTAGAERRFVAVEISYTADERDTNRVIRNAGYITRFTGTPVFAVAAGVFRDSRIDHIVTTDVPQPYGGDMETRVFWSQHEDIVRPD